MQIERHRESAKHAGRINDATTGLLDKWKKRHCDVDNAVEIDVKDFMIILETEPLVRTIFARDACVVYDAPQPCNKRKFTLALHCLKYMKPLKLLAILYLLSASSLVRMPTLSECPQIKFRNHGLEAKGPTTTSELG